MTFFNWFGLFGVVGLLILLVWERVSIDRLTRRLVALERQWSVHRIEVKPADILIFRHPDHLSSEGRTIMKSEYDAIAKHLGFSPIAVVLEGGTDIAILGGSAPSKDIHSDSQ